MQRVKVGVIGAGGDRPGRAHPQSAEAARQFEIVGVYDPSRKVRAFIGEEFGARRHSTISTRFWRCRLTPWSSRRRTPYTGSRCSPPSPTGLHVYCEKPLCYGVDDIDDVIAARDRAGKVLQVGYMKRFDPSYEAALKLLPGTARDAALHSVEVNDPDAWPFIRHSRHGAAATTCRRN